MTERNAPENPPPCPSCGKPPWRQGRCVTAAYRTKDDNTEHAGEFTVCMHCSRLWKLRRRHGTLAWEEPTEAEYRAVMPQAGPVAARFAAQRLMERLGLPPEAFDPPRTKGKRGMH